MASSGVTADRGDMMRYAEYAPKTTPRSDAEIDRRLGGTLIAVGLGVAAAGFAAVETSRAFSAYYKGGFEQKMTKREASLFLGISPTSTKAKVREAHLKIMVLNHPDKGGSPYIAAKIHEVKDLLDKDIRR